MQRYMTFAQRPDPNSLNERVAAVLDRSGTMGSGDYSPTRLRGAIDATRALIDAKTRINPEDEVGIVAYSSEARVIHLPVPLATGAQRLKDSLEDLVSGGFTNITAGLQVAQAMLFGGDPNKAGRVGFLERLSQWLYLPETHPTLPKLAGGFSPRIILLTDGGHNVGAGPVPLAEALKAAGTIIDCIGIGGSPSDVDDLIKEVASKGPDGRPRYVFIRDTQDLIRKFEQLANRIRPA